MAESARKLPFKMTAPYSKKLKQQWFILAIFAFLITAFRYPVFNEKTWINAALFRFNKIHSNLLLEELSLLEERVIGEEVFLYRTTQTKAFDSKNHSVRQALALILIAQEQQDEAINILQSANINPIGLFVSQGRYANSIARDQQALRWYYKAVELDPGQGEIWYEIGLLHEEAHEDNDASRAFQQSWDLSYPDSADPLAKLLRSDGRHLKAINVWQSALNKFPQNPDRLRWWRGLCTSLRATQNWNQADEASELAVREFPEDARLRIERGFALYYANHSFSEAIQEFEQAMALDDSIALTYAAIGEIFTQEEMFEKSIESYEKAISLDSSNPSWFAAQAESAFLKGDLEQARQLYERTISLWPNIPYIHYRMALVYRQADQKLEAIKSIEQAVSLSDQPNIQYFFRAAAIYEWAEEDQKAVSVYQQILELEPGNKTAVESINRLLNNNR